MPLTEVSKPKVSFASLSATSAAAAESIWTKSKKPSAAKQGASVASSSVKNSDSEQTNSQALTASASTSSCGNQNQHPENQFHQSLERQEFRRKFLEGLQFYCENSSLILNSDLPADLIEFVTSHGFSVESLGIILELKKSSSAFATEKDRKKQDNTVLGVSRTAVDKQSREQNFSEISRRLLQHWMSADSCAEAFVSLSLGEEVPGLIAECASFQRILFSVPDCFHLGGHDFVTFILRQILLSIYALTYGIKSFSTTNEDVVNEETTKVRSLVLANILDRLLIRYFSDAEYFHESVSKNGKSTTKPRCNPFQNFVRELSNFCKGDFIGRRFISKMLLNIGSHSATKLAKTVFSCNDHPETAASVVLYPTIEFLQKCSHWKFVLRSLPIKTATTSKTFWLNWATYIAKEPEAFLEFWKESISHWIILNESALVDVHSLFSATLAIVALAKEIKRQITKEDSGKSYLAMDIDAGRVLQNLIASLESVNAEKRSCGMALGQIVADLQFIQMSATFSKCPDFQKLKFESDSKLFLEILKFYDDVIDNVRILGVDSSEGAGASHIEIASKRIEVLDSDDDDIAEDNVTTGSQEDDGFVTLPDDATNTEIGIDSRILTLRTRKRKIPMYFSEIAETLLEPPKDEDEAEILRYISVLKIPVLLCSGVRIDSKMAKTISRCLTDMEDKSVIGIPTLFALYELFTQHPFEVVDTLANTVFDKDCYVLGQRLITLSRLTQIVQISSKSSCFNCYNKRLKPNEIELRGIYPEFFKRYFEARQKLRFCNDCKNNEQITPLPSEEVSSVSAQFGNDDAPEEPLTWRQIVDRRVASKTRYFFAPRTKTSVTIPDDYSAKFLPILWSCIANRLTFSAGFYLDNEERIKTGKLHDMFLIPVFQYLAKTILGTSGSISPHIRNVAAHAGELISYFIQYEDAIVRRSVLSLLAVTLSVCDGKEFVIEALSSHGSLLRNLDVLLKVEQDPENRIFLTYIQEFVAKSTTSAILTSLD